MSVSRTEPLLSKPYGSGLKSEGKLCGLPVALGRWVIIIATLPIMLLHGGMFYNSVGITEWFLTDPAIKGVNTKVGGTINSFICYFVVSDMVAGCSLIPVIDILGPRWTSIIGHFSVLIGWLLLKFSPSRFLRGALSVAACFFGTAVLLLATPGAVMSNYFTHRRIISTLVYAVVDISALAPAILIWLDENEYATFQDGVTFYIISCLLTMSFTWFCYPDEVPHHPADAESSECRTSRNSSNHDLTVRAESVMDVLQTSEFQVLVVAYGLLFVQFQAQTMSFFDAIKQLPLEGERLVVTEMFLTLAPLASVTCLGSGIFSDIFGLRPTLYILMALSLATSLCLATESYVCVITGTICYFLYKTSVFSQLFNIVQEKYDKKHLGTLFAVPPLFGAVVSLSLEHYYTLVIYTSRPVGEALQWLWSIQILAGAFSLILISWFDRSGGYKFEKYKSSSLIQT